MSILGVIVRSHPDAVAGIESRLRLLPGVEVADLAAARDGRLVIVIEDRCTDDRTDGGTDGNTDGNTTTSAAATLGAIALWPEVLNTSLVYEYSGPDSPPPDDVQGFHDWRRSLANEPPPQGRS